MEVPGVTKWRRYHSPGVKTPGRTIRVYTLRGSYFPDSGGQGKTKHINPIAFFKKPDAHLQDNSILVEHEDQIEEALQQARTLANGGQPVLINLIISPTPDLIGFDFSPL